MVGRLELSVEFSSKRDSWSGEKVVGWECLCPGHLEKNLVQTLALKSWAGFSLAAYLYQLLPLLFADCESSCKLPGSFKAPRRMGNNVFQKAQSPALVSSPEMPKTGGKLPTEPQDRCGMGGSISGGGHLLGQQALHGLFFLYGLGQILPLLWVSLSPSVQWN